MSGNDMTGCMMIELKNAEGRRIMFPFSSLDGMEEDPSGVSTEVRVRGRIYHITKGLDEVTSDIRTQYIEGVVQTSLVATKAIMDNKGRVMDEMSKMV